MGSPILAATVILLRPDPTATGEDYQVFLVKRHHRSGFMANAYVFPGGKVDPSDAAPNWYRFCDGMDDTTARARLGETENPLAIYVAALREMLEEANILLGTKTGGELIPQKDDAIWRHVAQFRGSPTSDGFLELVTTFNLRLRLDWLAVWDHWITPVIEPKRFDAHFFVAALPQGQIPTHDTRETTDSVWFSPTEALQRYYNKTLDLAPPTIAIMADLQQHKTVSSVFEQARNRGPCAPVLPVAVWQNNELCLLLPGDCDYPENPGSELKRAVLRDGRFYLSGTQLVNS